MKYAHRQREAVVRKYNGRVKRVVGLYEKNGGVQMKINEIPYVPQVEPARPSGDRSKPFEEELRKFMRGQVKACG